MIDRRSPEKIFESLEAKRKYFILANQNIFNPTEASLNILNYQHVILNYQVVCSETLELF